MLNGELVANALCNRELCFKPWQLPLEPGIVGTPCSRMVLIALIHFIVAIS